MNVYIYNADIICADCAPQIKAFLLSDTDYRDNGDSDCWPQGPHSDGGGEADYPQHCSDCNEFLENSLTDDGEEYVKKAVKADEDKHNPVTEQWKEYYSYLFNDEDEDYNLYNGATL